MKNDQRQISYLIIVMEVLIVMIMVMLKMINVPTVVKKRSAVMGERSRRITQHSTPKN